MVLYRIIGWFYIESCYVSCLTIKPKRSSGLVKQGGIPLLLVYCALCQPIFRISHRLVARLQRWAVKSCLVVPACLCSVCVGGGLSCHHVREMSRRLLSLRGKIRWSLWRGAVPLRPVYPSNTFCGVMSLRVFHGGESLWD